jgi:hypothetical protein
MVKQTSPQFVYSLGLCALDKEPVIRTKHSPCCPPDTYQLEVTGVMTSPISIDCRRKNISGQRLVSDLRKYSTRFLTQLNMNTTSTWRRMLYQMAFPLQREDVCVISTSLVA